jgi:signal transduction histidine kinase
MDALDPPAPLHDSGLSAATILAQHLPHIGVVVDTDGRCSFANPRACELLGAANPEALGREWSSLRGALRPGRQDAGRSPVVRRVDLRTPAGVRKLRLEVHAVPGESRFVLLLRDRAVLGRADRAQLLASEAKANQYALTGLVHDAKGPLNNFNLTLALMASAIARMGSPGEHEGTLVRCRRYLDVLQSESARLASCLDDMYALAQQPEASREHLDLGSTLRDVMRVLRHEATIREASIELDVPDEVVRVVGDARLIRLAFLGLCACLVDATKRGNVITLSLDAAGAHSGPRVQIDATAVALPDELSADLYRISGTSESRFPTATAARMIIEAHDGELTTVRRSASHAAFSIGLPAPPRDAGERD